MTTNDQSTQATGAPAAANQSGTAENKSTITNQATDSKMLIDGKKVVFEHDLIAAKESWRKQSDEQQRVHNEAIDKAKVELSATQTQVAELNAKVTTLTQQMGAASKANETEEVARLKKERDEAVNQVKTLAEQNTSNRAKLLAESYKIPAESLSNKSPTELDAIESALKALKPILGGAGNYAISGGAGSAVPESPMERAKKLLAATPIRGMRNATQ